MPHILCRTLQVKHVPFAAFSNETNAVPDVQWQGNRDTTIKWGRPV